MPMLGAGLIRSKRWPTAPGTEFCARGVCVYGGTVGVTDGAETGRRPSEPDLRSCVVVGAHLVLVKSRGVLLSVVATQFAPSGSGDGEHAAPGRHHSSVGDAAIGPP